MPTTYQFPPDKSRMRAVSIVPWGASGILLPLWPKPPLVWQCGTSSGVVPVSAAINLSSTDGFADADTDGASGAWLVQYGGSLVSYNSGAVASGIVLPANNIFTGLAYVPSFSRPYVSTASGFIFAGSGAVALPGSGFNRPTWFMATSGSTLFALASGGLASFSLTGSGITGSSGFTAYSLRTAMCLAATASSVAVGGWSNYAMATGYSAFAFSSGNAVMVALISGSVDLYQGPNEVWSLAQSVTGVGAPRSAAWTPDGTRVVVTDPVNGTFRALNYSLGALTSAQVLSLANAGQVSITPDGLTALVCQQASNLVTPFALSGSVWVSGAAVSLASPQSVVAVAAASAVVGYASGLAYLSRSGTWSVASSAALAFNPKTVIPASGNILAAGSAGASGFLAVVSGAVSLFTSSWTGNASGMIFDQGQIVVVDSVSPLFRCFQNIFTVYQSVFTISPTLPFTNIFVSPYTPQSSGGTIFCTGGSSSGTSLYQFYAPYNLEPIRNGAVAVLGSAGWSTAVLGSGRVPTALCYDSSGNIWSAVLPNFLYQVSQAGAVLASSVVPQFSGQAQTTPIGISAMVFIGGGIWGASSLAGPLVRLN